MGNESGTRRDAERNHETIVTAAIAVLAEHPEATMVEIASASGIGRSTLYRHFPDRSALITAIDLRVRTEAKGVLDDHFGNPGDRDPIELLIAFTNAMTDVVDRYRFMQHREGDRHAPVEERRRWSEPLRRYLSAQQKAGAIRRDLSAEWLLKMLAHTFMATKDQSFVDLDERRTTIARTVRSLLLPPTDGH